MEEHEIVPRWLVEAALEALAPSLWDLRDLGLAIALTAEQAMLWPSAA